MTLAKFQHRRGWQACRNDKLEWHCLLHSPHESHQMYHTNKYKRRAKEKSKAMQPRSTTHALKQEVSVLILTCSNEQSHFTRIKVLLIGCSRVLSSSSRKILFLIYFTYTCSDIHIISCCGTLTPDSGWFIQTIHANLHSYHARMGKASRQWTSL